MATIFSRATKCQEREMPHIRNGVYTHPDRRCCQEGKGRKTREKKHITYRVQRERERERKRNVSERESKWGSVGIEKVRRGIWGKRGFRGEEREGRAEDSEAGSRSMEVTWPAKPSGLSNFRLDTSKALATSLPRVARVTLCVCPIPLAFWDFPSLFFPVSAFFFLSDKTDQTPL